MGISHSSYIGPYLKVKQKLIKKTVDRCAEHSFPPDAAYCPKCGVSRNQRMHTIYERAIPDLYTKNGEETELYNYLYPCLSIQENHEEYTIETSICLPNQNDFYLPNRNDFFLIHNENVVEEVPFDKLDIPDAIQKFTREFADEIEFLKQYADAEVKFGYVSYYD